MEQENISGDCEDSVAEDGKSFSGGGCEDCIEMLLSSEEHVNSFFTLRIVRWYILPVRTVYFNPVTYISFVFSHIKIVFFFSFSFLGRPIPDHLVDTRLPGG